MDPKKPDDSELPESEKTPTQTPLARRPSSSSHHRATKPCPECGGASDVACDVCDSQGFTNEEDRYNEWKIRSSMKHSIPPSKGDI